MYTSTRLYGAMFKETAMFLFRVFVDKVVEREYGLNTERLKEIGRKLHN
jgi:hypothetical protein